MIKIFNSAFNNGERFLELDEVNIVSQNIHNGAPYILFEHKDYPLGALVAQYRNDVWECDLD